MIASPLDDIKGLGKVKKQALYEKFGTLDEIKKATPDELGMVKGIDVGLAHKIYEFLHKGE